MANGELLSSLKSKLPKGASLGALLVSLLLTAVNGAMNWGATKTRIADTQQQQEKRISALEEEFKNDLVTRRELVDFKDDATKRLDRIENKLDQELRFHRP